MAQAGSSALAELWQAQLTVPLAQSDDAAAALLAAGAEAVQQLEHPRPHGDPMANPAADRQLADLASDRARLIAAWPPGASDDEATLRTTAHLSLGELGVHVLAQDITFSRRPAEDWSLRWRAAFKPQKFGRRLWVLPSWEKDFVPPSGSVELRIDPGMAFGTGQHGTSALCLRAIERIVDGWPQAKRARAAVLDVGCGSGILALAAVGLGAGRVEAIDIDPVAVECAQRNAVANRASIEVSDRPLAQVAGRFDLVVANLLLQPLLQLCAPLMSHLSEDHGVLVISGLLTTQAAAAGEAFGAAGKQLGVHLAEHFTHHEWSALQFQRS